MASSRVIQTSLPLPRFEADGVTHARGCECPRCETGFSPSEDTRRTAAQRWRDNQEAERLRRAAEEALVKKREKARVKALRLALELEEEERRTEEYLRAQAAQADKVAHDEKLEALLAARAAGTPIREAIAQVEGHGTPRRR